jgi:hypothetical protein
MQGAHVVVNPAHERRVDQVGGHEEEFRVIELHGYDARYSIIGKPDLMVLSDLKRISDVFKDKLTTSSSILKYNLPRSRCPQALA